MTALRNPQYHDYTPNVVNIPIFLLRTIAATHNKEYIIPLKEIRESGVSFSGYANHAFITTLAYLGDMTVIPQLLIEVEGKYLRGALAALRVLAERPKASKIELIKWCTEMTSQPTKVSDKK